MKYISTTNTIQLTVIIILSLLLGSCTKDEIQGRNSLDGTWNINKILSQYADFQVENNTVISSENLENIEETGDLGRFIFSENKVNYNFTRNDTVFSGDGNWELKLEKVNTGFFKTNKWTLIIADDFVFDVTFEDATKNSEKNAKVAEFRSWPTTSGKGVAFFMSLKKQ